MAVWLTLMATSRIPRTRGLGLFSRDPVADAVLAPMTGWATGPQAAAS
jgi:hypothetical protein